jgi:hypothetical protein
MFYILITYVQNPGVETPYSAPESPGQTWTGVLADAKTIGIALKARQDVLSIRIIEVGRQ